MGRIKVFQLLILFDLIGLDRETYTEVECMQTCTKLQTLYNYVISEVICQKLITELTFQEREREIHTLKYLRVY